MNKLDLLFLHAFPLNGSSWENQVHYFGKDHRVLAPDLRGHGSSPQDNPPWFIHQHVEDLKNLLDHHGIERAAICGLSLGGYIALHFAQKYPARIRALVLCDTQAATDSNEAKDKRYATVQKIYSGGLPAYAEEFSRSVLAEGTLKDRPEVQRKVVEMISANKPTSVAMLLATLASRRDSLPFLPDIKVPTLVLVGDEDRVTPIEAAKLIASKIPGAKLEVLAGANHLSNLDQPEAFNWALEKFFATL